MLVAAPMAGAVSYKGGPADFAGLRGGIKVNRATAPAKREGSRGFELPVTGGNATMNTAPSGTLTEGGSVQLRLGSKRVTLSQFREIFAAGRVTISARVGNKTVSLFEGTTPNKITVAGDFSSLSGKSINLTLTRKGAAALNKAFGLKKPRRGRKDKRFKRGQRIGTKSFTAQRALTVVGGNSNTIYDTAFHDAMTGCGITLSAIGPATAIPPDPTSAPRGGVDLPAVGGEINAVTRGGNYTHSGGTHLDDQDADPATPGNQPRSSDLTNFVIDLTVNPPTLTANASDLGGAPLQIATLEGGSYGFSLTDTGGSVTVTGATLRFTPFAQQALASLYGCTTIPAGASLGTLNSNLQVE
jgi:hypothetical protein